MAPLSKADKEDLLAKLLQDLSQTPYACSSLAELSGGTANFVFRGTLAHPIPSRKGTRVSKTVIIKKSMEFVAANRDFLLDVSRCEHEESMLKALESMSSTPGTTTPKVYLFNPDTHTMVIEDFTGTVDLKSIIVSPTTNEILPQLVATFIGHGMGSWLRSFHTWTSAPAQGKLRTEFGTNEPMRKLKYKITYASFIQILGNFPEVLRGNEKTLKEVEDMATSEFEKSTIDDDGADWGIIHGDFWAGNVLVPSVPSLEAQEPGGTEIHIIDWELAQFGHRAYDLGQMIGDLYERKHFHGVDGAVWAIQGFLDGYGSLSDDMAFRTAIHVGVHLLGWYIRRDPTGPLKGTPEQVTGAAKIGMNFILKGWEKDRTWFESSVLACLFSRN